MNLLATLNLLFGEALLNFYPILIRTTNTTLFIQVLTRFIATIAVCYWFMTISITEVITTPIYYGISALYLLHVYMSYIGFQCLDAGVAMTLFYIYPLINILIKEILAGQKLDWIVIRYFILSLIGVYFIVQSKSQTTFTNQKWIGIMAIAVAAITESLIYTFYKKSQHTNPFNMLFILCFFGSIIMLIAYPFSIRTTTNRSKNLIVQLLLANVIMGVGGYLLRFSSIPKISTEWYSILSFFGVIFAYIYGYIFLGETLTKWHLIGTLLIFYAIYQIQLLE